MDKDYLKIAGNIHLSYFIAAAEKLGIKYEIIIPSMTARFESQGKHWFINNTATPLTNAPSSRLARAKHLANAILEKAGIPVPKQRKIGSEIEAIAFFGQYKNIVLKPSQNLGGKGVSILPKNEEEVIESYRFAKANDKHDRVLGEEFIEGNNFRLLVLGGKVISAIKRNPAKVTGDGKSTIKELIEKENTQRSSILLMPINIDTELEHKIASEGKGLDSILNEEEELALRNNANMTTGGTTEEVLEPIAPMFEKIAINSIAALDLEYGGVDLITPDITKEGKCAVNEVNYNPGLRLHYKVSNTQPKDVALTILKYIEEKYTRS